MKTETSVSRNQSADALIVELKGAFDGFEGLQAAILEGLRERPERVLARLSEWEGERHRGCAALQFLLGHLKEGLESGEYPVEEGKRWQERLSALLENEQRIHHALAQEKGRLEEGLRRLKRGKGVLKGYRSGAFCKGPVYMSQDA